MGNIKMIDKKAAFLLDNGFCEREFLQASEALENIGIDCRIISLENNIIKSWNKSKIEDNSSWGADYAVDALISDALPCDYDILVIIGGDRSVSKLQLNDMVKSFVVSFIQSYKPLIAYNRGINLLSHLELVRGYSLAAIGDICDIAKNNGGSCSASEFIVSKNLITLSRFRENQDKIARAVECIFNGESYSDNIVSSDNMPSAHKAA